MPVFVRVGLQLTRFQRLPSEICRILSDTGRRGDAPTSGDVRRARRAATGDLPAMSGQVTARTGDSGFGGAAVDNWRPGKGTTVKLAGTTGDPAGTRWAPGDTIACRAGVGGGKGAKLQQQGLTRKQGLGSPLTGSNMQSCSTEQCILTISQTTNTGASHIKYRLLYSGYLYPTSGHATSGGGKGRPPRGCLFARRGCGQLATRPGLLAARER